MYRKVLVHIGECFYCHKFITNVPQSMHADGTTLMCSSNNAYVLQSEFNENLSKIASWFNEII